MTADQHTGRMPRTSASMIAELKKAKYPFSPVRSTNWYGGILDALLAKDRKSDRIDLLADRTLKQMGILTRKNRRAFIVRQVEKAIRQLCTKGVLVQYTEGRVRLSNEATESRLDKFRRPPMPWDEEEAEAAKSNDANYAGSVSNEDMQDAVSDEGEEDEKEDEIADVNLEEDVVDKISVPTLPLLGPIDGKGATPSEVVRHSEMVWTNDERNALGRLLGPATRETSAGMSPTDLSHASPSADDITEAIRQRFAKVQIQVMGRSIRVSAPNSHEVDLEVRRSGEVRCFHVIPDDRFTQLLRYIGTTWCDLRVAVDGHGRSGVQSVIPSGIDPGVIVDTLAKRMRLVDDAAGL